MKTKFIFLTFLLIFSRGCDFYSTSLWFFQPDGYKGETNPLTSLLGFGWTGLIVTNVIIIGFIIYAFYYYSFGYRSRRFSSVPDSLAEFVSELYYNEKGKFYTVLFKSPKDKKLLLAHIGYVMIRTVIVASFLATIHNLCQYYNIAFYNTFRELVGRPLYVIYGLILLAFFFFMFRLWRKEFKKATMSFVSC